MRNLKLVHCIHAADTTELQDSLALSVDCDSQNVFCGTKTGVVSLEPRTQEVKEREGILLLK